MDRLGQVVLLICGEDHRLPVDLEREHICWKSPARSVCRCKDTAVTQERRFNVERVMLTCKLQYVGMYFVCRLN